MKAFRVIVCALSLVLIASAEKKKQPAIIEKRNVALAITTFRLAKSHIVKSGWRLARFSLELIPFVAQSFDRSTTTLALEVKNKTTWPAYSIADIIITVDGKTLRVFPKQSWAISQGILETEQTTLVDVDGLFRKMTVGQEVYLTIWFSDTAPPFDQMNFKLSPEQQADIRLLADKYDALKAEIP